MCSNPISTFSLESVSLSANKQLGANSQLMGAGPGIDLGLLDVQSIGEASGFTVSHPHWLVFATALCGHQFSVDQ